MDFHDTTTALKSMIVYLSFEKHPHAEHIFHFSRSAIVLLLGTAALHLLTYEYDYQETKSVIYIFCCHS